MATGGCESADTAVQFLHCGAGVVQICSAVHNQDFTVIQDYITGLKTYLYMQSIPDFNQWDGQSPPRQSVPAIYAGKHLPKFGDYQEERNKLRKEDALINGLPKEENLNGNHDAKVHVVDAEKVKKVNDQIGRAVPRIGDYNSLDNKVTLHHFCLFG
jgi:dihydropyrimidine dehydrogenase (NADP+)